MRIRTAVSTTTARGSEEAGTHGAAARAFACAVALLLAGCSSSSSSPSPAPSGGVPSAAEHNQQIWLLELATGRARELRSAAKRLRYPTFSPDGSTLAYLAVAEGNRYDEAIYFTEIATGADRGIEYPAVGSSNVPNGPLSWVR